MLATGVTLKKRAVLDSRKGVPNRYYFAVLCDRCAATIGRVPHDATAQDRESRVRLAKVAHFRECPAIQTGSAWFIDGDEARRIARRRLPGDTLPSISGKVERRGVAWRWTVKAGQGRKNMDSGYTDTMAQAMKAADQCVRLLMERGR